MDENSERIHKLSRTIEILQAKSIALDSKLDELEDQKELIINDLTWSERQLAEKLESLDAEIESVEKELRNTEKGADVYRRRLEAIFAQERQSQRQEIIDEWNARQMSIYHDAIAYGALIIQANKLREQMIETNCYRLPQGMLTEARDPLGGGKMRPADLLPEALARFPLELNLFELSQATKTAFEAFSD